MNASPFRLLLSRRLCQCRLARLAHDRPFAVPLVSSIRTQRNASASANAASHPPSSSFPAYGSSELLKRRYQPTPSPAGTEKAERARTLKRMRWSAYGIAACTLAIFGTISMYPTPPKGHAVPPAGASNNPGVTQLDGPPSLAGTLDPTASDEVDQVPTGTSTIPTFPKTVYLPSDASSPPSAPATAAGGGTQEVEYQLVGLGVRTVSFLSIQVYVVGLYIAVSDIARLQEKLVHAVADPVATTLVPGEKGELRALLLDPDRGEDFWNKALQSGEFRTAFRIVPTRTTDFMHLRDGFVRGITARTAHFASARNDPSFQDDSFGQAMNDLKQAFGGSARRKMPKGDVLLLMRDAHGRLTLWNESKGHERLKMGEVLDERVGRLLWLNYLAGKMVSSEPARQSVIDGVMEYVERPVGTVATQVV